MRAPSQDEPGQFRELLSAELSRASAFGRTLTLLMLRNAAQPHELSPAHLRRLARELRPFDRLALYASETVEVLLPETSETEARRVAARLLAAVRSAGDEAGQLLCGLSTFPRHGASAEALIDACRLALRRASPAEPIYLAQEGRVSARWPHQLVPRVADAPVTASRAMQEVYATVARLAYSTIPVLIIGETGSGKEVVAQALHQRGVRGAKRLVSLNCGAIPPTLVESVLFGHERGSFTGALQQSQGVFEQAEGGSVLLDEIGELAAPAQAALLRAIDTKHIRRVGGTGEVPIDVRLIAATHRDLEQMCREGRFRWDLYYRLSGFVLHIPPLRERPEDIVPLARLFAQRAANENSTPTPVLDDDVVARLQAFSWPGNARELKNAMEHAVVLSTSGRITLADLPQKLIEVVVAAPSAGSLPAVVEPERADGGPQAPVPSLDDELKPNLRGAVRRYEARLIVEALRESRWNRTRAARRLGLSVRTLSNRIKALGIKRLGFAIVDPAAPNER